MTRLTIITFLVLLAGCVTERPLDTDLVKDAAAAIQLGKQACVANWDVRDRESDDWHAEFHGGQWDVWQGDQTCHMFGSKISAANGKSDGSCMVCVD
jgi:hypothetical protein